MELKITTGNFEEEVLKSDKPVLVDFYADWCGPCKMMAPIVKQLSENYEGKMKVGKCNIDEEMSIAQKYKIMSIPTFIIFQNGEAVRTMMGSMSQKELEGKIQEVLTK